MDHAKLAAEIEHTVFFREIDVVETDINALKRQIANLIRSQAFVSSKAAEAPRGQSFDDWWEADGKFYDPDFSEVPWYDKRKLLAEYSTQEGE